MSVTLTRAQYAAFYGPTTKDKVRLGDTDLWLEIEEDYLNHGDECKFDGGKTIRDGMGQNSSGTYQQVLDLVITNVILLSHDKIVKTDIGIKGRFYEFRGC